MKRFIQLATRHSPLVIAAALAAASASAETVRIASAADWAAFAARVNSGEQTLDATLVADVSLDPAAPRVGTDANPYRGDFNGGGKRLSLNWNFTGTKCAAPFAYVSAARIHDLRVTGSIVSDGKCAAGLIGRVKSEKSTEIDRCRVSATVILMMSGTASCGGFIGEMTDSPASRVTLRDCLFDGSLVGPSASGCGGFVGWKPHSSFLKLYSCLFAPKAVTVSEIAYHSATFSRSPSKSYKIDGDSKDYYYLRQYGQAQGTDASAMPADALAAALGANWTVSNGRAGLALFPDPQEAAAPGSASQGATAASGNLSVARKAESSTAKIAGAATAGTLTTAGAASVGGDLAIGGIINGPGSFPVGAILLWHGSVAGIPDGWKLCDGRNGTPDLRDRFVVGAGIGVGSSYPVGATGGEKAHTLSVGELPRHRHEYAGAGALAGIDGGYPTKIRNTATRFDSELIHDSKSASYVFGTGPAGVGAAHENRPPYYALCYIMRVR